MYQSFFYERNPQKGLDEIADEIAKEIRLGNRKGYIKESLGDLKVCIVRAYRDMNEEACEEWPEDPENVSKKQLEKIFEWYKTTYEDEKQEEKTNRKGKHRDVTRATRENNYHFDCPYDKNQFDLYITNSNRPSAVFIMHMAVAFKLTPGELNHLLVQYGYLPLHVRNLHHLVIYSILTECDRKDGDYNQFERIKEWYIETIRLIDLDIDEKTPIPEDIQDPTSTRAFQKVFTNLGKLNKDQFMEFIQTYKHQLHWRHSAILKEHKRLASALGELYESRPKGYHWRDLLYWGEEGDNTKCYNFECFIENFCKSLDQKHFRENLIYFIHGNESNQRNRESDPVKKTSEPSKYHPTRECMILLWLFAEFYRGHSEIDCPIKFITRNGIDSCVGKEEATAEADDFVVFKCKPFDIHQYLFGDEDRKRVGNGEAIQSKINEKLMEYGWRPLDEKAQFDKMIKRFLKFKIDLSDPQKIKVTYPKDPKASIYTVSGIDFHEWNKEIPYPLGLLFELVKRVYAALNPESADGTIKDDVVYPLRCDLYEQL